MAEIERAKLIPVSGANDTPDTGNAIDVQFNPTSLKVSLSNTLKENSRNGNSRASQFVDKSSSSLTVELIFDTTYIEPPAADENEEAEGGGTEGGNRNAIEQGSDVRLETKKIAEAFIKPVGSGSRLQAPKRCLFQWGNFEFLGMVESFDETLDFFSPTGRPLRATVALKLKEDRYQFSDPDTRDAEQTPELSFTGNGAESTEPGGGSDAGNGAPAPNQDASPVPDSGEPGSWRDTALFNGVESPRLPSVSALAMPAVSLGMSAGFGFGIGGGVGIGLGVDIGISGGIAVGVSAGVNLSVGASVGVGSGAAGGAKAAAAMPTASTVTPGFKFGNSAAVGTRIPGAFSPDPAGRAGSLRASSLKSGALSLRAPAALPSAAPGGGSAPVAEAGAGAPLRATETGRRRQGVSVVALLKTIPDSGVGFD